MPEPTSAWTEPAVLSGRRIRCSMSALGFCAQRTSSARQGAQTYPRADAKGLHVIWLVSSRAKTYLIGLFSTKTPKKLLTSPTTAG
jgi:hypothetical protein